MDAWCLELVLGEDISPQRKHLPGDGNEKDVESRAWTRLGDTRGAPMCQWGSIEHTMSFLQPLQLPSSVSIQEAAAQVSPHMFQLPLSRTTSPRHCGNTRQGAENCEGWGFLLWMLRDGGIKRIIWNQVLPAAPCPWVFPWCQPPVSPMEVDGNASLHGAPRKMGVRRKKDLCMSHNHQEPHVP